jgi:hypothetical protein
MESSHLGTGDSWIAPSVDHQPKMDNLAALPAAIAASVAVYAHGGLGYQWLTRQLSTVEMRPTALSVRLFGREDVSAEVLGVTWHSVTAIFAASAVALYLSAFGALESRELLRFIALVHAALLGIGLAYLSRRLEVLKAPIPLVFSAAMITTAAFAWIASNSL